MHVEDEALNANSEASEHSGAEKRATTSGANVGSTRRSEIAKNAALARWNPTPVDQSMPREEFTDRPLVLGDYLIDCAVLSDRQRVLSERSVTKALGGKRGGSHWRRAKEFGEGDYRPVFLSAHNLAPYVPASLGLALSKPVVYKTRGGREGYGIPAELLPEVCEVFLRIRDTEKAQNRKILTESQQPIAQAAEILMRALAKVGIIALVDEATGFQEVRERDELLRLLEIYVAKELLPWTKRFPSEFYKEMFRLRGWEWSAMSTRRPKRVGKDTEDIIRQVAKRGQRGTPEENPVVSPGYRRYKNFQFLSEDVGNPHLEKQIVVATAGMREQRPGTNSRAG